MLDHPFTPGGSSAVEPGPWHYGADYVAVYFRSPPSKLRDLVPEPFRVDDGLCVAYVCEIVSVGDSGATLVATRPDRTLYSEAAVGVRVTHNGIRGVFFPVMWVTTEWSLLRGLLNGYQKRLADRISMTRLHSLNPGLKPVSPGQEFSGFCVKGPDIVLSVSTKLKSKGEPSDLPTFGATFGFRNYPSTGPGQRQVAEPVEIIKSNTKVADVWVGEGTLNTTLEMGDVSLISGAIYKSGFTISGSRVLTA